MLKSVTQNPTTRKFITTTMLATVVATTNANNLNVKDDFTNPIQTELVSKEGAEALKNNTYSLDVNNHKHNKNLNKLYIKSCEPDRTVKEKKNTLDAIYRVFGLYGATIELQRQIDDVHMNKALNSYTSHYVLSEDDKSQAEQMVDEFNRWKNDDFYTELYKSELEMYEEQPFPTAEKAMSVIDNHVNNSKFFSEEDVKFYNSKSKEFKSLQTEKETEQAKSDLLAYKVHMLNSLAFNNYIKNKHFPEYPILDYYFFYEFVNGKSMTKLK